MQIEVTFWLPLKTTDPNEVKTLTMMLEHVPRTGELVDLDVRLDTGERITRSIRVKDVHRYIKFNPDAGPPDEKAHVFSA